VVAIGRFEEVVGEEEERRYLKSLMPSGTDERYFAIASIENSIEIGSY
jgi:hypothetical protein